MRENRAKCETRLSCTGGKTVPQGLLMRTALARRTRADPSSSVFVLRALVCSETYGTVNVLLCSGAFLSRRERERATLYPRYAERERSCHRSRRMPECTLLQQAPEAAQIFGLLSAASSCAGHSAVTSAVNTNVVSTVFTVETTAA